MPLTDQAPGAGCCIESSFGGQWMAETDTGRWVRWLLLHGRDPRPISLTLPLLAQSSPFRPAETLSSRRSLRLCLRARAPSPDQQSPIYRAMTGPYSPRLPPPNDHTSVTWSLAEPRDVFFFVVARSPKRSCRFGVVPSHQTMQAPVCTAKA